MALPYGEDYLTIATVAYALEPLQAKHVFLANQGKPWAKLLWSFGPSNHRYHPTSFWMRSLNRGADI
jgi:hypothetical protein